MTSDNNVVSIETAHRHQTIRKIVSGSEWLTNAPEHQRALGFISHVGESRMTLAEWAREGRIFGIEYEGVLYYPAYQFDEFTQPLPIIQRILRALGDMPDPWAIAAWFAFPNGWLEGQVAPKAALHREYSVVNAASKRSSSYIA